MKSLFTHKLKHLNIALDALALIDVRLFEIPPLESIGLYLSLLERIPLCIEIL
jgi:hypothetical protein